MRMSCSRRPAGFTLLEIMVAMAIFGMLVATVYSSWMCIVKGAETGKRAAAAVQRSRIAIRTLEEALTSARSFAVDPEYYSFNAESGEDATLSFVARLPDSFPRSGKFGDYTVRRVTFSLEAGPDSTRQLVLRQTPLLMDTDKDEQDDPLILARNVKDFEMGFWDGRSKDWQDEWTQTNRLPLLVKVTLRLGGNGSQAAGQPEIVRTVALPSVTVQPGWQAPGAQMGGAGMAPPPPPASFLRQNSP